MKSAPRNALDYLRFFQDYPVVNRKPTYRLPGLMVAGILINHHAVAASTIGNLLPVPPLQTAYQLDQPNEMDVFQPFGQAAENSLPQMFRFGPVQVRPQLDYHFTYGSGIQSAPGSQESTIIQEFAPGVNLDLGSHWALNYTPTFRFYSSDKFKDTVDHSVALTGGFDYEAWKFGVSHSTQITSAPLAETGAQTDQSAHSTTLTASRVLNSALSADFALNQNITLVSGLQNSYDWNTLDWLSYKFWPRLNAGLGLGGGYVLTEGNTLGGAGNSNEHQTYEQIQARVNWRLTDKISLQVNGGLEDRQFSTAGTSDSLNPVFGAAIQYQPFAATQISLNASRTISSSDYYLAAQQTESTIVGVNLNQRLFRKYNLALGATYTRTDFDTSSGAVAASLVNRSDDLVALTARLSHSFFKRGTWAVFYSYSEDTSSTKGFSFQSNQLGFEISYNY